MMTIVLETNGLTKHFDTLHAVDGVSLQVTRGEIFGFLGPNGAGKTTTIGMLLGLIYPTAGDVRLFDECVTPRHVTPLARVGALVGASPSLVPYLTVREHLQSIVRLHKECDGTRIGETLARLGVKKAADRKAGELSTGMKQRLGLAMALLHRPDLLILDEPTNGMDPAGMREVRTMLRSWADEGTTVFLSSHLLHEVEQICDRVAVLDQGKIVAQGRVETLLGNRTVVKVRVANVQKAANCLERLPGVDAVHPNGAYIRVTGRESEAVVAHLARHNLIPTEVTSSRGDLEDLFLQLTAHQGKEHPNYAST
jgi:ABC-2 type transport system ATP-binding protein